MSEENIGRRKEKCENCTKQCNKKQSGAGVRSLPEADVANREVPASSPTLQQQVLLSACLSCEGCVSEEESLKISQQNLEEVARVLGQNKKCDVTKHQVLVVSVCSQSLPFFAVKFGLDIPEATRKLCGFLKSLGVQYVFDTTLAAGFSILESQREFVQRYRKRNHDNQALPMFTSSCPGWIRYAERVLGSLVTPHICTARSPQQIMGCLVKDYFTKLKVNTFSCYNTAHQHQLPDCMTQLPDCMTQLPDCMTQLPDCMTQLPDCMTQLPDCMTQLPDCMTQLPDCMTQLPDCMTQLHISFSSLTSECVCVPGEVFLMMEQMKVSVADLDSAPLDHVLSEAGGHALVRHEGKGSEGFLEHVFKYAAKELFGLDVDQITYKTLRNRDFQEVCLERDGEVLLQFASVYGFRNIQTLVHRMRTGQIPYQLVEVLSCPGGCVSGRGQAEGETGGRVDKALVQQMEDAYSSLTVRLPDTNPDLLILYQDWLEGQDSTHANTLLHTQYTQQTPSQTQTHIQW
ncbi:nuclear prelamin A recognition factor-like [Oncorhynchus keta]|uniref:nuclear prelamin A recognition factor-like n=1 Tax=Oncorhynchus keta TaxID=8018 RepID=UPI00227B2351|nr:nuclear prelamin A recognition factor-like [Oncorhynchus keta]